MRNSDTQTVERLKAELYEAESALEQERFEARKALEARLVRLRGELRETEARLERERREEREEAENRLHEIQADSAPSLARDVFDRDQAARFLGFHPDTITNLCKRGELRHMKVGSALRFRKQWCVDFLEAKAIGGTGNTPAADAILPNAAGQA